MTQSVSDINHTTISHAAATAATAEVARNRADDGGRMAMIQSVSERNHIPISHGSATAMIHSGSKETLKRGESDEAKR